MWLRMTWPFPFPFLCFCAVLGIEVGRRWRSLYRLRFQCKRLQLGCRTSVCLSRGCSSGFLLLHEAAHIVNWLQVINTRVVRLGASQLNPSSGEAEVSRYLKAWDWLALWIRWIPVQPGLLNNFLENSLSLPLSLSPSLSMHSTTTQIFAPNQRSPLQSRPKTLQDPTHNNNFNSKVYNNNTNNQPRATIATTTSPITSWLLYILLHDSLHSYGLKP